MRDTEWIKNGYFAHRGLHNEQLPENSIAAFRNAVEHGFDIEMDIRITKDSKIIVFHDSTLKRLCNNDSVIEKLTYDEIRNYYLLKTDEKIPLLTDVLDIIPISTSLLIELKTTNKNKTMVKEFLKIMNNYNHQFAIHSFNPFILKEVKRQNTNILRGQIAKAKYEKTIFLGFMMGRLLFRFFNKPDFINYRFEDLPRRILDKLKNKGYLILSYTARSQSDLDYVKEHYHNAVFENFIPKRTSK